MILVLRKRLHVYIKIIIKIYIYHTIFTFIHKKHSAYQGQNNTDKGGKFAHTPPLIPSAQYYQISTLLLFKTDLKHKHHYQSLHT